MNKRHGMSATRFYGIWRDMKSRTSNVNHQFYSRYGGNGIGMCSTWKDFMAFKYDMYESYLEHAKKHSEKNTTLDRIDGTKGYELSNCRWATYSVQNTNKKHRKPKTVIGFSPCGDIYIFDNQLEFANKHNLSKSCISKCVNKDIKTHKGWTFEYMG